jgi:YVTN family beta-propeller protein
MRSKGMKDPGSLLGLLAAMLVPLALQAVTSRIYVTNSGGDTVDVIDAATNKVVQQIKGIECPHGVTFSPDGTRVYISNESENVLDVVDRKTGEILNKVPLSGHPNNIDVTKDGSKVFVCIAEAPGSVDVIDTRSMKRIKTIPIKGPGHNVNITPDGKYAVAGSVVGKSLNVIDVATLEPVWELDMPNGVRPIAFEANPDGSTYRIFAQLSFLNGFSVVDFATHEEVAEIKFPEDLAGYGIAEGRAYTPAHGLAVSPDGKQIWAASTAANAVFAYSLPDLKLLGHVSLPVLNLPGRPPIPAMPQWLTLTPDGKTLYVSDEAMKSVSVIDTQHFRDITEVAVGEVPKRNNTLVLP